LLTQFAAGLVDNDTGEDRTVSFLVLACNEVDAKGVVTSHREIILSE